MAPLLGADLERDVLALSPEDQRELPAVLIAELDFPDDEIVELARDLVAAVERTDRSLLATIDRLEGFDAKLERARVCALRRSAGRSR